MLVVCSNDAANGLTDANGTETRRSGNSNPSGERALQALIILARTGIQMGCGSAGTAPPLRVVRQVSALRGRFAYALRAAIRRW